MLYNPPTGGAANDPYVGKNVAAGIQGSKIPPGAAEFPQREIMAVIAGAISAGLAIAPSNGDLTQMFQAIKFLIPKYAPAGTGATSKGGLAKDGSNNLLLAYLNLVADNRSAPVGTDVLALERLADGATVSISAAALASYVLSNIVQTGTFQQVVPNPLLYVRPDGSDANNGLANTAAGAFRTIAAALAAGTSAYNFSSGTLKIKLGVPATYDAPSTIPRGSGTITIEGDIANQAGYILAGSTGSNALVTAVGACVLNGLTISSTNTSLHVFAVGAGANAALNNVTLAAPSGTTGAAAFCVGGLLQFNAGCALSGSAAAACDSDSGGSISINTNTVLQILGNPNYSAATVVATNGSRFTLQGGASISGSANGSRYLAVNYSIISVNGAGPNAIPGSSAGSTSNGIYG